ncbi:MAG: cupin domain-containing protein [Candidatus Altiarchaeia archaeon]
MKDFPDFMKNKKNAIAEGSQSSGIEGYVYDGADGSQMIHWTCGADGVSKEHAHNYDEYMVVVSGRYDMLIGGKKTGLAAGDEYYIPKGVPHAGAFIAGTRTIHCFGGKRAERKG